MEMEKQMTNEGTIYLNTREAARHLGPSTHTLDRYRAAHSNPTESRAIRAAVAAPSWNPAAGEFLASAAPNISGNQGGKPMIENANYMNTREVAAFLGLSPRTLDRYRVSGAGPKFHKFGNRVRYLRFDVEAWAAERRYGSTSGKSISGLRAV